MQHHAGYFQIHRTIGPRFTGGLLVVLGCLVSAPTALSAETAQPSLEASSPRAAATGKSAAETLTSVDQPDATKKRIQQLIRQLGDSRFSARRAAASTLRQIGAEAFDQLHAATNDSDPEVASSARYLLQQISVRWVERDDPSAVRTLFRDYDRQAENVRLRRVDDLAELADGEGIPGLCRIARFDRSPIVSRMAALAIIRPETKLATPPRIDPGTIERELGGSSRTAAEWLRRYLVQLRDPAAAVSYWEQLIDDEVTRLEQNAPDTSVGIVNGLLWNMADVYRGLDNRPALLAVVERMMEIDADEIDATSIELLTWLAKNQSWEVLDEFLTKYQPKLEHSKRPLYYAAIARAKQGKPDVAEELAKEASGIEPQNVLESFLTAKDLEEQSQFDWSVREYRNSIDDQKVASHEGILARVYLAGMLHDYEKDQEAADVLEPLAKAIKNEGQSGQLYAELQRYYRGRLSLPEPEAVSARLHFYRAGQYRLAKDWKREQEELGLAIKADPTDADVLIAMHRVPETDEKWRANVRKRIDDLCRQFQQEIDDNPGDPNAYNQWAWLVSNTEGDFQKAIRYSHRSLELIPPGAGESAGGSFLDTLGRCYFAAGDVENAIKHQREAIKRVDYMQVMHRQLAQFEQAEKRGAGGEERGASDVENSN